LPVKGKAKAYLEGISDGRLAFGCASYGILWSDLDRQGGSLDAHPVDVAERRGSRADGNALGVRVPVVQQRPAGRHGGFVSSAGARGSGTAARRRRS
jgi:hypothetical protein